MSYASVAAQNAPPPSQQPHPDPGLLNITPPSSNSQIKTSSKINLVAPDFKEQLERDESDVSQSFPSDTGTPNKSKRERRDQQHSKRSETGPLSKEKCIGGLMGIVNVGVFGFLGRTLFLRPQLRKDATTVLSSIGGSIALLAAQNHLFNFLGIRRFYSQHRGASPLSIFLARPLTYKNITNFNSVIIGVSIGIASCADWSKPNGKKMITGIFAGLLALWGVESYALKIKEEDK